MTNTSKRKQRKESLGQTIGGVLFGFEQQVLRTTPPPQELVRHARPDAPIPAGDGSLIHIGMPGLELPAADVVEADGEGGEAIEVGAGEDAADGMDPQEAQDTEASS